MVFLEVLDVAGGRLVLVRLACLARTALGRGFGPRILRPGQEALQELLVVLGPLAHRQLSDLHLTRPENGGRERVSYFTLRIMF